ncbi:MAG: type II asparaginase [Prevotellaceae bacterium]|nr:type II asparaginase [Prevotellaceae bacterium]
MKKNRVIMLIVLALVMTLSVAAKPKVRILATGGTIAGVAASSTSTAYTAGQATIETLIAAVPEIKELAEISGEQVCSIGSQDMNDEVWLKLAKRINQLLNEEGYDGVLITHGTDTMEETAYFLNLTVHSDKPVVLVGAMRSSSAISADGPANLYNGVAACADPDSKGHGVMCCMNNQLIDAKDVIKRHTTDCATFAGGTFGSIGYVYGSKAYYYRQVTARNTVNSVFDVTNVTKLPQVGIVYGYANCSPLPFKAFMDAKFDGIVLAGVGDGNFYKDVFPYAEQAVKDGIIVVRSSRCPTGPTCLNGEVDDDKYHFCASLNLNPQKSRILLMLALTRTHDWQEIQKFFQEY